MNFWKNLWSYQWLQSPQDLDEVMTKKLYELSQGVPDIVVKLFCMAQARSILLAKSAAEECLSVELLEDVFEEEFSIVKPMLDALRSGDKQVLAKCDDLVIPKIEGALLNSFDHLKIQSLNKKYKVEVGDASETEVVNSAVETLTVMGVSPDVARPLVLDVIKSNLDISVIQIIHQATSSLSGRMPEVSAKPKKEVSTNVKADVWGQLTNKDLRKIYADKTGTMYEIIDEHGLIYPLADLMAA